MMMSFPILVVVGFTGLVFILAGWWMKNKPPKKINHIYGYRTPRSMKSQENWDFAQVYSGKLMLLYGVFLILLSLPLSVIPIPELTGIIIGVALIVAASILIFVKTESKLKSGASG